MSAARAAASIVYLASAMAFPGHTHLHAQTGSVAGTVHDSIAHGPLADAAVFLWETPYKGVSDAEGRFRIDDVPTGDYDILFFHTRLGELGISPGPRAVTVRDGRTETVRLATPSMATVVRTQCLLEDRPAGSGAIAGRVLDGTSEVALGGAHVKLSWHEGESPAPRSIDLRTGPDGWYRSCSVPPDTPVLLSGSYFGREGARHEVSVTEDGFIEEALPLFDQRSSHVAGRMVDNGSDEGVEGAETWLRGTTYRTLTNGRGSFEFKDVPPGTYMLMTDHLAYGTKMDTLVVPDGRRLLVEMRLDTRPIEMPPLTVTTESPTVTIDRRRGGVVITRDQIERVGQQSRDLSDVIRALHVPGVVVQHTNPGWTCVGFRSGQVAMMDTGCVEMVVFINDVRATDPSVATRLSPDAVERMVVYKPLEAGTLFGLGGANGVWMIYTRGN